MYLNRRYVMNFRFSDPNASGTSFAFPAQTQSLTISEPFLLSSISAVVRLSGQYSAAGYPSTYVNTSLNALAGTGLFALFDFLWKLSDTSRQREWTRGWQPSAFLQSSVAEGPQDMPRRNPLPQGTELKMSILPTDQIRTYSGAFDLNVAQYEVEVSFIGVSHVES